jgi:hypothetical protein
MKKPQTTKQNLTTTDENPVPEITHDDQAKIERLRALNSITTGVIEQRDQLAKGYEDAVKKIRILEVECRSLERERDAARAIASDLMEQLKGLK